MSKVTADQVVKALEKDPELLKEVKSKLNPEPRVAFAVLMVEHEFGQRDEGYTLWPTEEAAKAHKQRNEGPGAPGQYFSYEGPYAYAVTPEVWEAIQEKGRVSSRKNHLPGRNTVITPEMVHMPEGG